MTAPLVRADPLGGWRPHLASAALAAIMLLVIGGLWAVDRALTSSRRTQTALVAVELASIVDAFFAAAASGLTVAHAGPAILGDSLIGAFPRVAEALLATETPFSAFWLADSTGTPVTWRARPGVTVPGGLGAEGPLRAALRNATRSSRTVLSTPLSAGAASSVALVEPIRVGRAIPGYVGGLVRVSELRDELLRRHPRIPGRLRIRSDSITVLEIEGSEPVGRSPYEASAPINFSGARGWRVDVQQSSRRNAARFALWAIGAVAVTALLAGMRQERKQAVRLTLRSVELERLSAELLQANRAKSEFLANVSHELRTPLTAIVGFVDLLRDGVYGELAPRQVNPVERIAGAASHLRHLVDQVLDIAKMAAGRLEVHTEPVALRPFVLDVVSEVEPLVNERGLQLSIAVGGSLPKVRTDPMHLRQILTNLLGNAVKFTPRGVISVRARMVSPAGRAETRRVPSTLDASRIWVAVQVSDTGIGIAPADIERIFEEFEQVDSGSRGQSATRGTGLGLSISRRLARLLGGDLTVTSELGQGSTFSLWLPVHPSDVPTGTPRASTEVPLV